MVTLRPPTLGVHHRCRATESEPKVRPDGPATGKEDLKPRTNRDENTQTRAGIRTLVTRTSDHRVCLHIRPRGFTPAHIMPLCFERSGQNNER